MYYRSSNGDSEISGGNEGDENRSGSAGENQEETSGSSNIYDDINTTEVDNNNGGDKSTAGEGQGGSFGSIQRLLVKMKEVRAHLDRKEETKREIRIEQL